MSRRLPSLTPDQVIRALERGGIFVHHTTGSHRAMRHSNNPALRVTVSRHGKVLKRDTLRAIIRQAGLTRDQFLDLL